MSFTSMHMFRSFCYIINSLTFTSSFLGGPSSKTKIPQSSGTNVQPLYSEDLPQPSSNLTKRMSTEPWKTERAIAVAMLAIIPSSFVFNSVFMNYLLAATLVLHAHWGMDVVLLEYCPRKALPAANIIRYFLSTSAFAGLCYFNYNNMGLTKALKALWSLY